MVVGRLQYTHSPILNKTLVEGDKEAKGRQPFCQGSIKCLCLLDLQIFEGLACRESRDRNCLALSAVIMKPRCQKDGL